MIFVQLSNDKKLLAIPEPVAEKLVIYLCRKLAEDAYFSKTWEDVLQDAYKAVK